MLPRWRFLTTLGLSGWIMAVASSCPAQPASVVAPAPSASSPVPFYKSQIFSARHVPLASASQRRASRFATTKGGVVLGPLKSSRPAREPDPAALRFFADRPVPQNQTPGLRRLRNETTLSEIAIADPRPITFGPPARAGAVPAPGAIEARGAVRRPP
jgi:hypothetical protein